MEILAYEMQFHKETIESTSIQCIPFDEQFFHEYMKIYNECFYEMRKTLAKCTETEYDKRIRS